MFLFIIETSLGLQITISKGKKIAVFINKPLE
jgi:hypothetical protein